MSRTFPANLEQQFDEAYRKANLVCSKAELLAYNNRPNKHGSPRRPKNAFFIFTVEYRKRIKVGLYSSTTTQSRDVIRRAGRAWQRLSAGERRVYVLAASVVEKKFYENNPGYVYNPRREPLETVSATATANEQGEFAEIYGRFSDPSWVNPGNVSDPADVIYSIKTWNGFSWNGP
ncbi:2090_t:CDS:1 [Paraglomus occultum]|uniref:2090_t:CDS:1 n=1 Tax=Paraglomus occultum TaxID=144539 RepID=A0A9N9B6D1_9GLOM|nr:2090_t:CDS:1 [Paraglomus occultum]